MNKKIFYIIPILILSMALYGCNKDSGSLDEKKSTQTIKIAGSTSVAPLMKELKFEFEKQNPETLIEIQETGSSAGISSTIKKASDIGMSSRELKDKELKEGLEEKVIALDGIALIVNPKNKIENLTREEITSIYKGEIKNWSEVGGDDGEIIVVYREDGSGTRGAFDELLHLEETIDGKKVKYEYDGAIIENSTGAVKMDVSGSKNAIGYISLGSLDETVKPISVDGIKISEETIQNKSYPISRDFIICTLGEAKGKSLEFINFIFSSEGQSLVSELGYVSIIKEN